MARLIQSLGFDLGSDLLPATENNKHGHFEEVAFINFHDQLISRYFPERAPFCEWLPLADAETPYGEAERNQARSIWEAHRAAGGLAWKDPRTSLFLDLWTTVLPDAKVVICLRHPYQIHLSLLRRGEPFLHADYAAGILGGTLYNQRILRTLSQLPRERFVVVDVEQAFKEPGQLAEKLAHFLGASLPATPSGAISPEEFHFEEGLDEALDHFADLFPEAIAAYRGLKEFDLIAPVSAPPAPATSTPSIRSEEARLIEFEEIHGLRKRIKKMLIRSIAADRRRISNFDQLSAEAHQQKDRLIEDLSRFNEQLKQEVIRQRAAQQAT